MNIQIERVLESFVRDQPAEQSAIDSACDSLGFKLPEDYAEVLRYMNGGEGFMGDSYFRLYPVEKLPTLNQAYRTEEFAPGLIVFGSNGGGEAYAFDIRTTPHTIVKIPFIPMTYEYMELYSPNFTDFLTSLTHEGDEDVSASTHSINPSLVGKEIHEIQPIVFGGNATDPNNKAYLEPEQYAEYVVWWNRLYREVAQQNRR